MRLSIFGFGYVGVVSGACLARMGHEIIGVDVNLQKIDMVNGGFSPIVEEGISGLVQEAVHLKRLRATSDPAEAIRETDVSFVSVGTPSTPSGSVSLETIEKVTAEIGHALKRKNGLHTVVFRSTIPPGTTCDRLIPILADHSGKASGKGFEVCFNPEFLREGSSVKDFQSPPYTVVGAESERVYGIMEEIYTGIDAPFVRTGFHVAEAIKYLSNLYHAVKICFANEVGVVLKDMGVDAREAMEIFCQDSVLNISRAYLRPGYAFGGSCLPKDLRAFLQLGKMRDLRLPMLENILPSNDLQIERAYRMVAALGKRKVALLGLAFKSGTDDLRESPIVTLAERLIGKGFELKIYDPHVQTARLTGSNKQYIEKEIPHMDRLMREDIPTALAGAELVVIGHLERDSIESFVRINPRLPVIDLQGVNEVQALGAHDYHGICWNRV